MTQNGCIEAVAVNHNTSRYAELMLRSLYAKHAPDLPLSVTLYDNASTDDTAALEAFALSKGVTLLQSGFSTQTLNNSHGEILRRFVIEHPDCAYYLFLDADACFIEDDTLVTLRRELDADPAAFGIGPRLSWDGLIEMPEKVRQGNPDIYTARLHPCCALVKNTPLFRAVVEEIGLSCVNYLWAERTEYLDAFKLMTKVLRTHGYHHRISSALLLHFFSVSYDWDPAEVVQGKARRCDEMLAAYRR